MVGTCSTNGGVEEWIQYFSRKPDGEKLFWKTELRWKDKIRFSERGCACVDCIKMGRR